MELFNNIFRLKHYEKLFIKTETPNHIYSNSCYIFFNSIFKIIMKNLLERLKPEYLKVLEYESLIIPHSITQIKTQLKYNYFFTNLNVNTAFQLCNICKLNFGLVELDSLFKKHE